MTKQEYIEQLCVLNPYRIIKCDMDGFQPYVYVDISGTTLDGQYSDDTYEIDQKYIEIVQGLTYIHFDQDDTGFVTEETLRDSDDLKEIKQELLEYFK